MSRKIYLPICVLMLLLAATSSCKKEHFTPVDISTLNPDEDASNTALDQWLKTTFLDEYNIDVIYHYHRYYHESDRNVSPPKVETVQPMMTTVLEGYIQPYRDVAGVTFIRTNAPKEFVLYGSTSYDAQGIGYAGTASGGVRVNLFGLDNFSLSPGFVTSRLNVIHHEFTHILNQRYVMPPEFAVITGSTYKATWTSTPLADAHNNGYVSSYASQNPVEDFAEMTSSLLVKGQPWFDNWVKTSGTAAGQAALRAKESSVVNYFTSSLNVDFRALQKKVQLYIKDVLKDPSVTFLYWLGQGLYKTMTINLEDQMYTTYGISPDFANAYNQFKAVVLAANTTAKYHMDYLQFMFNTATTCTVRIAFTATAGSTQGTQYLADYTFGVGIDSGTGAVTFTKIAQAGTTGSYANAALFAPYFAASIQQYLTNNTFNAEWLQANMPGNMYTKTGGFYQTGVPSNYFYGVLAQ
jgi:substrate import-associated zinc metallohydrolase lipoprotein